MTFARLFHLIGDIHQPLHRVQLFSREYRNGDRGGNEMCVRVAPDCPPLELHRLWDGLTTSTNNIGQLRDRSRASQQVFLVELQGIDHIDPESWAKESYEIAMKIAYQNGSLRGTPKGQVRDCRDVSAVTYLFREYRGYSAADS